MLTYIHTYIHTYILPHCIISLDVNHAQLAGAVVHTDCLSAERLEPPIECPEYDTKHSDGEIFVMQELWGMCCVPSLPSLLDLSWPAPDRVLSIGQIEQLCMLKIITWNRSLLIFELCTYAKLICLKWNCFWHWNYTSAKLNCLI